MLKLCRACRSEIADGAVVCPSCGLQQSTFLLILPKHHRAWSLAALCVCVLGIASAALAVGVVRHKGLIPQRVSQKLLSQSTRKIVYERSVVLVEETRKVYPYSIVPGGATTVDEAKLTMNRPDVRANYTNVDFTKLHQVKLDTNLSGYVSYRYGEKIYWTAKKLTLRKGELVFTDGVHIVRGRCLNCYSAVPMAPIRPKEPTEKVLDTPVDVPVFAYKFPLLPVEAPALPPTPEELTPVVPILPVAPPLTPGVPGGGGGIWFPIIPIIPPIHRHPGHNPPPTGPIPPIVPPAVVPEPRYGVMVMAAFLAMMLAYRSRRRSILRLPNLSIEKTQPGGINVVDP
ncbi:MAG TPA: hypothetical protein VK724_15335 [Bryobacteraceae bacterium]|nr:hypothetical protein [Bryobacteraceae bacterium]